MYGHGPTQLHVCFHSEFVYWLLVETTSLKVFKDEMQAPEMLQNCVITISLNIFKVSRSVMKLTYFVFVFLINLSVNIFRGVALLICFLSDEGNERNALFSTSENSGRGVEISFPSKLTYVKQLVWKTRGKETTKKIKT
jgi:hypothetical protein